jgi:hypothetical protein
MDFRTCPLALHLRTAACSQRILLQTPSPCKFLQSGTPHSPASLLSATKHPASSGDMDLVFKLAEQKEEGVEDVTVDEWRQSGVSLFGVCSLFSKRGRPQSRSLISSAGSKGGLVAVQPKSDPVLSSASAPSLPQSSASRSLSPTSPSSPSVVHNTMIMVHPASFSSLDLLLDVNDMQVRLRPRSVHFQWKTLLSFNSTRLQGVKENDVLQISPADRPSQKFRLR